MGAAYDSAPWADLAVAMAGAAAALAGLLFVAVSINLDAVVEQDHAPRYVAQALIMLVSPVFVGLVLLIPDQPDVPLGVELLVVGVVHGVALARLVPPSARAPDQTVRAWLTTTVLPSLVLVAAVLVAAIGTLTGRLGGLYWLPAAVVAGLLGGLANAWILLIEIRRPD